jgi:hypothetical protein
LADSACRFFFDSLGANFLKTNFQATIRLLMSIGELGPLPDDAVITPVTFRVHRRHMRGILAGPDARENGARELAGEWVTTKESPSAQQVDGARNDSRVVLYLHGGASPREI